MALNRPQKRHFSTAWELKQKGRVSSCLGLAGNGVLGISDFFTILSILVNDYKRATSIDFRVTNKL